MGRILPGLLILVTVFLWQVAWDVATALWILPPTWRRLRLDATQQAFHQRTALGIAVLITVIRLGLKP
jgi:hypothetical protein